MGYSKTLGRATRTRDLTLAASAARTANGSSSAVETGDQAVARLLLDVTARTGTTPTLNVTIETSYDGTTWRSAGTFTQATATGQQRGSFMLDRYVRASWVVGGTTPNFTFSITGEAV